MNNDLYVITEWSKKVIESECYCLLEIPQVDETKVQNRPLSPDLLKSVSETILDPN